MNEDERMAIAKRATESLRRSTPAIRETFSSTESLRQRSAKLYVSKEMIRLDLVPEKEVVQHERASQ